MVPMVSARQLTIFRQPVVGIGEQVKVIENNLKHIKETLESQDRIITNQSGPEKRSRG